MLEEGLGEKVGNARALTRPYASCTMNFIGRLAQRLERSVYTRKVVRSNRTVPTIPHRPLMNRIRCTIVPTHASLTALEFTSAAVPIHGGRLAAQERNSGVHCSLISGVSNAARREWTLLWLTSWPST